MRVGGGGTTCLGGCTDCVDVDCAEIQLPTGVGYECVCD